jgi:glycosyltransferase involved in cell wall biosynthesis
MKIVFINRYFYPDHSATSQMLTDLAFHLAKAGAEVSVVTGRQVYDDPGSVLPKRDSIQGVVVTRVWTTRFGRQNLAGRAVDYLTFYLSAAWTLLTLLRPGDIVVAKTDPPLISVIAAVAAKARGVRLVNWTQDLFPEVAGALGVGIGGLLTGMLRGMRNWSLRVARTNVVIGDCMAKKLLEEGVRQDAICVIHNWSDGHTIQPVERKENILRVEWELAEKFVVGYSGNMGRAHEFATILDAAERLNGRTDIVFLFVGGGPQRDWIRREAQRRALTNIRFKPYQPRERLALSLSVPDVHVISLYPSLEGLIVPSKFYGIAAAGRPAIYVGDPDGEIPRILGESGCGYATAIGDSQGLASCIQDLAGDAGRVKEVGRHARDVFDRRFAQTHAMRAWEKMLIQASTGV